MTLYRRSYEVCALCSLVLLKKCIFRYIYLNTALQESLKRPISGSDFGYEIPLKDPRGLEAIMSKEDLTGEGTTDVDGDACDVDKYV